MRAGLIAVAALAVPGLAFQAGSLEGKVVNANSGEAVRRVTLTLAPVRGDGKRAVGITDESGRFAFREVPTGAYRLNGERPGFQKQQYGARLNPDSGTILTVAAGEPTKDVLFKLVPDVVMSGTVLDQDGQPMPNLIVRVLKNAYAYGKRKWTSSGASQTNDRGEFRIAGLRGGRYTVLATDMNLTIAIAGVSNQDASGKPEAAYASTYYGNTPELTRAAAIDLRPGDDRRGLNIQMVKAAAVRVKGKVVDYADKMLIMTLVRKNSGEQDPGRIALVQQEGIFDISGVPPGSYLLTARSVENPAKSAGALLVEVADRNVEGLEFRLGSGGDINGRVIFPPDKTASAKDLEITLESVDFALGGELGSTPSADGKFTLKDVPAVKYRVRVSGIPENGYLKSVKLGGQEIDDGGAEMRPGTQLEIAVSLAGGQVEGSVVSLDEKPMSGATVALIPDSGRESRYANATTDEKGAFALKGIAPGKYKLIAWEDVEPGAFRDPEFVRPFESAAQAVALEEGDNAKVTLKAIPFSKIAGEGQ